MGAEATAVSSKGVFGAHSVCVGVFSGLPYWFSVLPLFVWVVFTCVPSYFFGNYYVLFSCSCLDFT